MSSTASSSAPPSVLIIGGIPDAYDEKLLSTFITTTSTTSPLWVNVPRSSSSGNAKGYGFCAYENDALANEAAKALDGKSDSSGTKMTARIAKSRELKKCTHKSMKSSSSSSSSSMSSSIRSGRERDRDRNRDRDRDNRSRSHRDERDRSHRSSRRRDDPPERRRHRDRSPRSDRDRHHRSSSSRRARSSRSRSRERRSAASSSSSSAAASGDHSHGQAPQQQPAYPVSLPYGAAPSGTGIPGVPPAYPGVSGGVGGLGYPGGVQPPPNTYIHPQQHQYQMQQFQQMQALTYGTGIPMSKHTPEKQDKINRELHIGNTNPALQPAQLQSFLNAAMVQGGLATAPGPSVVTVRCSGKFAFAEFRSIDEANNAMNLLGIILMGRPLKIARSRDFNGKEVQVTPWHVWMAAKIKENPALEGKVIGLADPNDLINNPQLYVSSINGATTSEERAVRELYVGNIPHMTTEALLSSFIGGACVQSKITETNPVTNVRLQEKFCFVEFRTPGKLHVTGSIVAVVVCLVIFFLIISVNFANRICFPLCCCRNCNKSIKFKSN
jgi:RNA recognition motif-containing protein